MEASTQLHITIDRASGGYRVHVWLTGSNDLLFWSDGGASAIYHVAIYTGNGMMIHAPRPGRSVEEVSMYYWITPTFFARP